MAEVERRFKRDTSQWLIFAVLVALGGGFLLAVGVTSKLPPLTFVGYIIAIVGGLMFIFRFLTAAVALGVRQGLELSQKSGPESDLHLASGPSDVH